MSDTYMYFASSFDVLRFINIKLILVEVLCRKTNLFKIIDSSIEPQKSDFWDNVDHGQGQL